MPSLRRETKRCRVLCLRDLYWKACWHLGHQSLKSAWSWQQRHYSVNVTNSFLKRNSFWRPSRCSNSRMETWRRNCYNTRKNPKSKMAAAVSRLSVTRAGTGGQQHCTAERLGMGEEHFHSSSCLPTSMQGDLNFNTSEVEALKRALKQARATAETSCMNTAANLVTALPPLYIIEGWLDYDTLGKQRRRQQPPVLPETYNTTRERIRSLKQLEGQVYELRSTRRVIRLGEGTQKSVEEYQSHNAMALQLYSELKRVRLQMKAGGDRVEFSDSDISKTSTTNPFAITISTTTKPKRVARLNKGNNSKQSSSTTVTIQVVSVYQGLNR